MGRPIKIRDLAFKMVQLSGLKPYMVGEGDTVEAKGDVAIRIIGLRPGEKMYEELSYGDNLVGTAHPRIMAVSEAAMAIKEMRMVAKRLGALVAAEDQASLLEILIKIADYLPKNAEPNPTATMHFSETANKVVPISLKD